MLDIARLRSTDKSRHNYHINCGPRHNKGQGTLDFAVSWKSDAPPKPPPRTTESQSAPLIRRRKTRDGPCKRLAKGFGALLFGLFCGIPAALCGGCVTCFRAIGRACGRGCGGCFRDIGRAMSTALAEEACGGDEQCVADALENPDASAICGSDGIPFKILVVKHLARRRWSELLNTASFEAMDTDGDGKLQTAEVAAALATHTASLSAEQEAEAMVRSFDVDGDGAVTAADVRELMRHFDDEAEADLWRRVDAKTFEATAETLQAQTRGKARRREKYKNATNLSNVKRGEEIQARFRPEDE